MTPGWSPLEMYTIFTILVLSGHIPLEKFLKFNTLTISVTPKKKTCLVDLCPKWCYSSYVSPSISWDSLAIPKERLEDVRCVRLSTVLQFMERRCPGICGQEISLLLGSSCWSICCQMMSIRDEFSGNFLGGWATTCLFFITFLFFSLSVFLKLA